MLTINHAANCLHILTYLTLSTIINLHSFEDQAKWRKEIEVSCKDNIMLHFFKDPQNRRLTLDYTSCDAFRNFIPLFSFERKIAN